jgi:(p)ppGpp synthase/HD superfamily hydrolase
MNLINLAEILAEEAHNGQFRLYEVNGQKIPYIEHPRAVRNNVIELLKIHPSNGIKQEIYEAVAILHDAVEDQPDKFSFERLRTEFKNHSVPDTDIDIMLEALRNMTRLKGQENYFDYIQRVSQHPVSHLGKLADLKHNLSDLKPGNLKDKYLLAQAYLNLLLSVNHPAANCCCSV